MYIKTNVINYKENITNNINSINNNFILLLIITFLTLFYYTSINSTTDSQWVNEQTSIIADNNINIRTKNNTNLTGSVVASNSDNLSLNTGSLTYSDLNDFYREETKGYNFGTSVGGNTDKGKANMAPNGSTTIGMTHTGQEKEQITRATIGLGNITINSEPLTPTTLPQGARDILAGLNRNVNNSQEITKDIITGALNASVTIDNRLFTSDGRSEITNNFVNLPSNLVRAGAGVTGSALNILESAYNGVKNLSIDDAVDSWKANQSNLVAGQSMSSNDKSREVINNLSEGKSQQDIENALNSGFAKYDENGNATNTISLYNDVNDNNKGTHQNSTGDNYINSAYTDMTNTSDVLKVASHENAHNYTKNEDLANASQKYTSFSYFMGNVASGDSVNKNGTATNTSWNNTYGNTQQINYNTSVVRSIRPDDRSNSVFVDNNNKIVKVVDNDNYNAYKVSKGTTREDIEKDPEKYENENNMVLYSDLFLKDEKLSGENLTLTEQSFNNPEVHNELLLLDSFDKNKSISENISNLLSDGKIDTQTASNLQRALNNGADDFSLSYLMANNLWSGIADNSYGISYPTQTMTDSFNINIEYRDIINPAIGQEVRTLENGNCRTAGCGEKGSARSDHTHNGTDILLNEGGYVVAPMNGILRYTGSNIIPEKSLPSGVIENNENRILMLYIDINKNLDINKNGSKGVKVKQGGVIGKGTSNSEFTRVYGNNTPQHTHVEQQNPKNRKDRKDIQSTLFPKQQRELKK